MRGCEVCKEDMGGDNGCFPYVKHKGKEVLRSLEHWCDPGEKCNDCAAPYGTPHHYGCDVERCPVCGTQFIGCDCFHDGSEMEFVMKPLEVSDIIPEDKLKELLGGAEV